MARSVVDPPESYTDETLRLWRQYPELKGRSRQRPSPEKLTFINEVLRGVYVGDATSCNKSHVRARYKISNDMLQYIPEDGRPLRTVITDDEAYSLIVESHLKYGHAGREKVFHYLKDKFYHITREEVGWVLKQCAKCKARCRPTGPHDTLPKTPVNHNIETLAPRRPVTLPQDSDEVLLGQYSKKFQALEAESKLEGQWMDLCSCVARDVRGPMGLDLMLGSEDKGKAWDDHFLPRCEEYTQRYWGTKVEGRWWAGNSEDYPDRVLIKDFLRRLFMNFFQKERVHRARIARKAARTGKPDATSDSNSASEENAQPTSWMRSHPPIRIPQKPTEQSPPPQEGAAPEASTSQADGASYPPRNSFGKRPRGHGMASSPSSPINNLAAEPHETEEPSTKNPRLDRLRVILTAPKSSHTEESSTCPNSTLTTLACDPPTSGGQSSPLVASVTPNSAANTLPVPTDILFMTYIHSDSPNNEIRLIHGRTLTHLPFKEALEKLRRKHRLSTKEIITAIILDFKGKKLCIDAADEDGQLDWETWLKVEGGAGAMGRQVELEIKVAEVIV